MLGFSRWGLAKGLAALLCIVGLSWLALDYFVPAPPSKFTIATGAKDQTYEAIGKRYRDILARSHVDVELRLTAQGQTYRYRAYRQWTARDDRKNPGNQRRQS